MTQMAAAPTANNQFRESSWSATINCRNNLHVLPQRRSDLPPLCGLSCAVRSVP